MSYLKTIKDPYSIITPIESGNLFPEKIYNLYAKYKDDIFVFQNLILSSDSSEELLEKIRSQNFNKNRRMTLLKLFRRCVSNVCDTETTKKIKKVPTETLVRNYGHTFKPISRLKEQFSNLSSDIISVLSVVVGEYDERGQQGYKLTSVFFDWFENEFPNYSISGPRGAGRDIEFSELFLDFNESCPCDFVIQGEENEVLAIGFARYDSTRGGAQSDDRTGGNSDKVKKLESFFNKKNDSIRILFLSDGPGLAHKDTWEEACELDDSWNGNVRVVTLALADERVTEAWLRGVF